MRIAIWDDQQELVASYDNDKLMLFKPMEKDVVAFYLFQLTVKFMADGGGASYGGPLTAPTVETTGGDYAQTPGP